MRLLILAMVLFSNAAVAGDEMNARLEFMKLAFACSDSPDSATYQVAHKAAVRQAQIDQSPLDQVIELDRSLRDGSVKPDQIAKSECAAKMDAALLMLKTSG